MFLLLVFVVDLLLFLSHDLFAEEEYLGFLVGAAWWVFVKCMINIALDGILYWSFNVSF